MNGAVLLMREANEIGSGSGAWPQSAAIAMAWVDGLNR